MLPEISKDFSNNLYAGKQVNVVHLMNVQTIAAPYVKNEQ